MYLWQFTLQRNTLKQKMKLGSFARQIMPAVVIFPRQPLTVGQDGHFLLILNMGDWGLEEQRAPGLGQGFWVSHVPTTASRPPILAPSCREGVFPRGLMWFPLFPVFFPPLLEVVPMIRVELELVKILWDLLQNRAICTGPTYHLRYAPACGSRWKAAWPRWLCLSQAGAVYFTWWYESQIPHSSWQEENMPRTVSQVHVCGASGVWVKAAAIFPPKNAVCLWGNTPFLIIFSKKWANSSPFITIALIHLQIKCIWSYISFFKSELKGKPACYVLL